MNHRARKRFGQNFLHDQSVVDQIISAIHPRMGDRLVEIGPGRGALTVPLLESTGALEAIELDRDLLAPLRAQCASRGELTLYNEDALKFDFTELAGGDKLRVVGNLPYNISTPLLFHLLDHASAIEDMHFMLQQEVVLRLAAQPGSRRYGRLTIMVQIRATVEPLFGVPPEAFKPQPKVESMVVQLRPRREPAIAERLIPALDRIVSTAFNQRRKALRNSLKKVVDLDDAAKLIDLNLRAEDLSVNQYLQLAALKAGEVQCLPM